MNIAWWHRFSARTVPEHVRVHRGLVAGLLSPSAQHPVQLRPVERPAVPQPEPDERRLSQPVVPACPQVGRGGPGGGGRNERHASLLLGPGTLQRDDPDEPLAHQVEGGSDIRIW
jgi:hypothetical protein